MNEMNTNNRDDYRYDNRDYREDYREDYRNYRNYRDDYRDDYRDSYRDDYRRRDFLLGMWSARANNSDDLAKTLKSSFSLHIDKVKDPVKVMFNIPDDLNQFFLTKLI